MKEKTCEVCGRKLVTAEEIDNGICEDCEADLENEEMDNFASAILSCDDIPPNF